MRKFKIGDRVRIDPNSEYGEQAKGHPGTVLRPNYSYYEKIWVRVRWDGLSENDYPAKDLSLVETDWDK